MTDKKEFILQVPNDMQFTCVAHPDCIPHFGTPDGRKSTRRVKLNWNQA